MATCINCGNEYDDDFRKIKAKINRHYHEVLISDEDDMFEIQGRCPSCAICELDGLMAAGREYMNPCGWPGIDD